MNRFVALTLMVVVPVAGVVLTRRPTQVGRQGETESPANSLTILDAAAILHREAQKRADLDIEFVKVRTRIARKRQIALQVIEKSMTLHEAALHFRELIAECGYSGLVHAANEGSSEEERIHRDVIGWVVGELARDPARQAAEVARLEAELTSLFR